jgi:hypothetical protein
MMNAHKLVSPTEEHKYCDIKNSSGAMLQERRFALVGVRMFLDAQSYCFCKPHTAYLIKSSTWNQSMSTIV